MTVYAHDIAPLATSLPGLHRIALPTPFPVGPVNVYLAEGEPLTLVDCGVRNDETWSALGEALRALGYDIRDIERVLITHHHTDHLGMAGEIARESRAEIWTHPQTVRWLERPRETRSALWRFVGDIFRRGGVPESTILIMEQVSRYLEGLTGPGRVHMTVDEGELLEMAGRVWVVYHTPGHAGDLICLYQPESRVLLSSDHVLRDVSSNPLIEAPLTPDGDRPRRLLNYMHQLRRISALDVSVTYPGHGQPVDDLDGLVTRRLDDHEARAEKLFTLFEGEARSLYALTVALFPSVRDTEMYLALSETLGHLDLLDQAGRVVRESRGERDYWRPVAG
ncbi:MAG: MBL fold metallo-hydrolase [Anaerolineae bacterium]|nr:MBL fold metallo-hydrolase [Anaerolineae bacterium]